jgi:plastocyanin
MGALGLVGAAGVAGAGVARADTTLGQITAWGAPGTGAGQFFEPTELGVDPRDNSVYVVDQSGDQSTYRLQKFSSSGSLIASATISRAANADGSPPVLLGVAVDPGLNRVYLLQTRDMADTTTGLPAAEQILVFSTQESGTALQAPSDLPSGTLPVPDPTTSNALDTPSGFAVDPTTHDLLVAAYDRAGHVVVQRIGSDGTATTRFVDTPGSTPLSDGGPYASELGLAVGPDGEVYLAQGDTTTTMWVFKLPPSLSSVTAVQEPATGLANTERWHLAGGLFPVYGAATAAGLGPQLAISPDGSTLYWSEIVAAESSFHPGSYLVRGYSLAGDDTSVLYGGGTSGTCEITATAASIAPGSDGDVYVLDHGDYYDDPAGYGSRVVEFGPGGSGCPAPTAAFSVSGDSSDEVTVQKGDPVTFDASGSALHGATPTELDWDFDGSGTFADAVTGSPPSMMATHTYLQKGTYTVGLKMTVSGSLGNPPLLTKTVHVVPGTPTAAFSPSTSTPAAGATVTFDASGSVDPTGSAQAGPTHTLKTYTWSFGDGSAQQQTSTATVQHTFANAGAAAVARTVTLTVQSNDDVDSAPVSHQITVQGTPAVTPPPPPPPPPPAPTIVPPGIAKLMSGKLADASTAGLTIGCAPIPGACAGTLTLTTTVKVKPKHGKAKSQVLAVGSARFGLAAGEHRTIRVKLSSKAKALLRSAHKLKLTLKIVTRNSAGATVSSTRTLTLTAPKPKPKKKKH